MPQPNQRISEYILVEQVGAGSFGQVWKARHHVWADQLVAIKVPTDPQFVRNLQREGAAIHGLVHPNVARAIGFDPYADPPYLITEFVPGSSLRPLIKEKKLSIDDVVQIMRQVLGGLKYAHAQGVVHRDVKPENILIHERAATEGYASEGVVKVTDFDLGRASSAAAVGSILYSQSMHGQAAAEVAGTLDYMAPEQRSGGEVDHRADLYACGVILYEMLTGERPAGTDVPSDLSKSVPRHLDEIFRRSYARLDKRFESADQFLQALGKNGPPPAAYQAAAVRQPGGWVPSVPAKRSCPQCRQPIEQGDQFCMHCGVQLVESVRRCPKCGAYPDPADHYCIFCGDALPAAAGATVG